MNIIPKPFDANRIKLLLTGCLLLGWAACSQATPPTPPAQIVLPEKFSAESFVLQEKLIPIQIKTHEKLEIVETIATIQPLAQGKQLFDPPAAETMLAQRMKDQQQIETQQQVPLKLERPGTYIVDIRLKGKTALGSEFSDRLLRYVIVDDKGTFTMLTPTALQRRNAEQREQLFLDDNRKDPQSHQIRLLFEDTIQVPEGIAGKIQPFAVSEHQRIQVRPEGPSEFLRKHSVDHSATSWTSQDPITVKGRVVFRDIDGVWKPLINASVTLWDDDVFGDENLGNVATDWDGRWSFSVNNDDGWLQDGRDLYYTFKLENTRWSTGSCNFLAGAYEWKSSVHDDMSDGTVLDFGSETASTDTNSLPVWSTLNLAWNHAVTVGGWDPGKIDACFPASGTFYNGKVNVEGSDFDGPDSITHEYAHGLMAHAYVGGDPSPGGGHGFGDCNQNQSLSWSEGWATGFMLSVRPDGAYNWHEGDGGQAIEGFASTCRLGETSEGWVAGALLDFMDQANDDNGGNQNFGRDGVSDHNNGHTVGLSTILRDTLVGSHHNNTLEFWNSLSGELDSSQRPLAQEIMRYNWMSVAAPISCVASKVATLQERNPDELLSGLRKFRDLALKNWLHGRELINMYYRNSPELAVILLKNPNLVPEALNVIKHFSALGNKVGNHQAYQAMILGKQMFIPSDIADSVDKILGIIGKTGSPELKADVTKLRSDFRTYKSLTVQQVESKITALKAKQKTKPLPEIRQNSLSKSSSKLLSDGNLQEIVNKLVQ